ncbi:hypothetical protein B0A50_01739 [Salinomyces thailandicus]|uniref:DUF7492 domain-containing protein n=1 Tax=Salinomyces thailandicus TaxID=706561 RepID=A0A4U0UAE2_9PEZI|nr:hypothetical protein B0A50_01739 [Salinomyces thailandica]
MLGNRLTTTATTTTMNTFRTFAIAALAALSLAPLASAHSWIEQYQVIGDNGSYIGDPGYSRGYVARTDEGYTGFSVNYLVPETNVRINSSDLLCHPSQRTSNYTNPAYPMLKVQPGGYVAMKYLENGHVTLPWNQLGKPNGTGTVFVYGTTQPADDEIMVDVLKWSTDGTGGNGKGFLLTAQNFDDGRCHQINCGNISTDRQMLFPNHVAEQPTSSVESWCETDLQIPASQPLGKLTTYWVWQWPTEANKDCTYPDGKDEYYTTCADFEIIDSSNDQIAAENKTHLLVQENPQSVAVSDFKSRKAFTTSPPIVMISGTKTIGEKTTATSGFMSACSAGQTSGPAVDIPASCDPVTVFSGAPVASVSQSYQQLETTHDIHAAQVTEDGAAVPSSAASTSAPTISAPTSSATPSTSALPSSQTLSANGQAAIVTATDISTMTTSVIVTTTLTLSDTVTATTYASPSASSADINAEPSADTKSGAATGNGIVFPTISPAGAAAGTSSTPASAGPTVASNGMVEDMRNKTPIARAHLARHANAAAERFHPRHFVVAL